MGLISVVPLRSPFLSPLLLLPIPSSSPSRFPKYFWRGNKGSKDINFKGLNPFLKDLEFERKIQKGGKLTPKHDSPGADAQMLSARARQVEREINGGASQVTTCSAQV